MDRGTLSAKQFETLARHKMSAHYGVDLVPGVSGSVPKKFDMVSVDGQIAGDAKYYTLVKGTKLPPAKLAIISEHVWLLEKTGARERFLVFGNDRAVPALWLRLYGNLNHTVTMYFLSDNGELEILERPRPDDPPVVHAGVVRHAPTSRPVTARNHVGGAVPGNGRPVTLADVRARRQDIERLAAACGAHNIRVFGSVARGEATPGSDIDLLVDFEPGRTVLDLSALILDLEDLLGRKVDVKELRHPSPDTDRLQRESVPL